MKKPSGFSNKEVVGKDLGEWKGRSQVGLGTNDTCGSRDGPGGSEEENTSSGIPMDCRVFHRILR